MTPDVLLFDRIGGAYTARTMQERGLGGSEIELLQVARGLTGKGYRVVVANGVTQAIEEDGIQYVPTDQAARYAPSKALYLQRFSTPTSRLEIGPNVRVIVRANDVYCPPYDVHRPFLESGRASLVANTKWQADLFPFAKDRIVLPPMLEPMPKVMKQRGLFVFASGAMKGLTETLALWKRFKYRYASELRDARLVVVAPGWGERAFDDSEYESNRLASISSAGDPTPERYRELLAKAEGLFMVSTMAETFCCAAALAERAFTRVHILCRNGLGGIPEALLHPTFVTEDETVFERDFIEAHVQDGQIGPTSHDAVPVDLSPAAQIDRWEETLHLKRAPITVESTFAPDPTLAANEASLGSFFGDFLSLLRSAIVPGGSEFGVGLTLFSLAASTRASRIVEIGRFKGFSTLALAAACKLQAIGWQECRAAEQRPDVDYSTWTSRPATVTSIDPVATPEADDLLRKAGVADVVRSVTEKSARVTLDGPIDLLFIDGSHALSDVRADVQRFVPQVRPGGYFVLHDYFGWYDADGVNGSAVAQVVAEDLHGFDRVLIDTGYASLVIFRKATRLTDRCELVGRPTRVPPRSDGRPTVGLCLIAKGDEASTVATRAIVSAKKLDLDALTVVCDAPDATADIARSLGADVFIRPTPAIDWDRGIGLIAGARNEALAIAERRTDYVLVLDADDWVEGSLPAQLVADFYDVTIYDSGLQYPRVQLFRSDRGFRYVGIIHEVIQVQGSHGRLESVRYQRGKSSYGYQDQDPPSVKFSKHARMIQKWLIDHPDDTRAQFYLARSYHDAGRAAEAIAEYEKRIAMGGWDEERFYSAYQIGLLQIQQGIDPTASLLRAHEFSTARAEPLVALARWYRDDARRQFSVAYTFARRAAEIPRPASGLFMHDATYQFEALAEQAVCAYWVGSKSEALTVFEHLLSRVPQDRRAWCEQQIAICRRDLAVAA